MCLPIFGIIQMHVCDVYLVRLGNKAFEFAVFFKQRSANNKALSMHETPIFSTVVPKETDLVLFLTLLREKTQRGVKTERL